MAGKIVFDSVSKPPAKVHDLRSLDLAFAMDSTSSMGTYIDAAKRSICTIFEEIVASEKGDVRLALVNYRDHPPQDYTYVTEVHDFTNSSSTMKGWLDNTKAHGGGDLPEAVADALQDILNLSWRTHATKICVCISDAPPHGIGCEHDKFPNGCPLGIDPMNVVRQMAAKGITLYVVGCEPSISPYKGFFTAIAYMTGGQYVPLTQAGELSKVIIGGAREEMGLERLMEEVNEEVRADIAAGRSIDEAEMTKRVHSKMISKGVTTTQLQRNKVALASAADSVEASHISKLTNLSDVRAAFKATPTPAMGAMATPAAPAFSMGSVREALAGSIGDEKYDVEEKPISEAQANRMVKKSLARNMISKKY
ncbi:uncharacterized protein LOC127873926 [Dreissena polymorpha]|uniref:VWFA domain-containing protein n=1 Tax=Dreissena polymorpha TaxID=45954 RepID=A0A9D4RAP8_DREPO|nr:uncharacterized protein LOC127873926 [Dreissena polymorpha]KAH3859425.1 hypothetical protein DPMN_102239 [Dreissena polymorpha]